MTERRRLTLKWLFWGAILLLFIIDRLIKNSAVENEFVIKNISAAFGIPFPSDAILVATFFILLWLAHETYFAIKSNKYFLTIFFVAIIAGGVSNMFDRVYFGGVVDYIQIVAWFPIFNIADILITLGIVGVGLYYHFKSHEKRN